jgi:DNA-directed RNA polymerase sigma subunit (sigma70/sigma32)
MSITVCNYNDWYYSFKSEKRKLIDQKIKNIINSKESFYILGECLNVPKRDLEIHKLRYNDCLKLREIATIYNLSIERIRQILKKNERRITLKIYNNGILQEYNK